MPFYQSKKVALDKNPNVYFTNVLRPINPFSPDGKYGKNWVALSITDDSSYKLMTCKDTIFCFKISKATQEGWEFRAMDYIEYNLMLNRNVVYIGNRNDYEIAKSAYHGHGIHDPFLRSYEPAVLVHSTTPTGYKKIIKDGALKSWNKVREDYGSSENEPIGALLGDPDDFRDYVMLGGLGVWNEIVVNSKEKGYICMDTDCEYVPGARFYFSTTQLIQNGLFVRDGAHYKVRDILPLSYSLFCATVDNVFVNGEKTPRAFSEAADEAFKKYCGGRSGRA